MLEPCVFAYVITTVGSNYKLHAGSVPWVREGTVFFGPCKKNMRPKVNEGDYIMGISPAGVGEQRRVLLWMRVAEKMSFAEAYGRGETDRLFRLARRNAIHVRPKQSLNKLQGVPTTYEHIPGAQHSSVWRSDIKGKRDVFLLGANGSWAAGSGGPVVTSEVVELLREGITWRGNATTQNPLTENARGKHIRLTGKTAQQLIDWMPSPSKRLVSSTSGSRTSCRRKCSCD